MKMTRYLLLLFVLTLAGCSGDEPAPSPTEQSELEHQLQELPKLM